MRGTRETAVPRRARDDAARGPELIDTALRKRRRATRTSSATLGTSRAACALSGLTTRGLCLTQRNTDVFSTLRCCPSQFRCWKSAQRVGKDAENAEGCRRRSWWSERRSREAVHMQRCTLPITVERLDNKQGRRRGSCLASGTNTRELRRVLLVSLVLLD